MTYRLSWLVPNRIILIEVGGVLTEDDVQMGSREGQQMLDEGTAPVHAVVDLSQLESLGAALYKTTTLTRALEHPNRGWAAILDNQNPVIRSVLPAASTVFSLQYHLADSREEALAFLRQVDPTLPDA